MKSIALINQKGGVAKTTSVINIAAELGLQGYKVLIVDGDSQGNATQNLGMYEPENPSLADILLGEKNINDVVLHTSFENLDLIPANLELQFAEMNLQQRVTRNDNVFKKAMSELTTNYDFVLIDCPPSLSTMTVNILTYVDYVLIPIKPDRNSLEGYDRLLNLINAIREDSNEKIKILGTFITVKEGQTSLDRQIFENCQNSFGDIFINQSIRKCVEVREAPMCSMPVCYYKRNCGGARDYRNLAKVIIDRTERGTK